MEVRNQPGSVRKPGALKAVVVAGVAAFALGAISAFAAKTLGYAPSTSVAQTSNSHKVL